MIGPKRSAPSGASGGRPPLGRSGHLRASSSGIPENQFFPLRCSSRPSTRASMCQSTKPRPRLVYLSVTSPVTSIGAPTGIGAWNSAQ